MRVDRRAKWLAVTALSATMAAGIALVAGPSHAQEDRLRITSPTAGFLVRPGDTVTITVAADYSVEKVALVAQHPLGVGQVVSGGAPGVVARGLGEMRPLRFALRIPSGTQPGSYRVTAIGTSSGEDVESDAVTLDVERAQEPVRIWTEPSLVRFTQTGDQIPVRVLGAFGDGSSDELTKSSKTSFASGDPGVATVSADGVVTAVASGKTTITVRSGSLSYSVPVRVE